MREAFIDPLRSVLIVDDQYPTWDEIFNSKLEGDAQNAELSARSLKKEWNTNPNGPLGVVRQFRNKKPGFVIDIYDGVASDDAPKATQPTIAGIVDADHLHQSDLLVLDYNLEGAVSGLGGKKARGILRSVLTNRHFNLIALHTDERDIVEVLFQCLFELLPSCTSKFDDNILGALEELDEIIDEKEQIDKFDRAEVISLITDKLYFDMRKSKAGLAGCIGDFMHSKGPFGEIGKYGKDLELKGKQLKNFFFWAIREYESKKFPNHRIDEALDDLNWRSDSGRIWLRTARGFVAFVEKNTSDILGELQKSIEDWQPTPSRLLSAKYRYELSSAGVVAEDRTLSKRHAFAYFYKDLKSPGNPNLSLTEAQRLRTAKLKAHVAGKSEAITSNIEDAIITFAEKIQEAEATIGANFESHYGVDLSEAKELSKARAHYNSYVSTLGLKSGTEQLDSGHIFRLSGNWWVCATPACDLQLGQNSTAFVGSSPDLRPFTALLLENAGGDYERITNNHINSGVFCFIETKQGIVECLGLQKVDDDNAFQNGKVTWRTFVAEDNGLISDGKLKITIPRLSKTGLDLQTEQEAEVVGKLRYEYALNYIQKVGTSVTRIGLGYAS